MKAAAFAPSVKTNHVALVFVIQSRCSNDNDLVTKKHVSKAWLSEGLDISQASIGTVCSGNFRSVYLIEQCLYLCYTTQRSILTVSRAAVGIMEQHRTDPFLAVTFKAP